MSLPKHYNIYPSLLDKFQKYLDSDEEFEGNWNATADGDYKRSHEEIMAANEQALLDCVNRVPHEPIEAADKGTCFNALVDWLNGSPSDIPFARYEATDHTPAFYVSQLNGFTFCFNAVMAETAAKYFEGAIPQYRCSAVLDTDRGYVNLYGYIDEICRNVIKDIKTTGNYTYGKFEKGWQKEVYPFCLVESGDMDEVAAFEYTVFKWIDRANEPTTASMAVETYEYNHERTKRRLRAVCELLIDWLEANRYRITDKKVFGE